MGKLRRQEAGQRFIGRHQHGVGRCLHLFQVIGDQGQRVVLRQFRQRRFDLRQGRFAASRIWSAVTGAASPCGASVGARMVLASAITASFCC